jgi:hypothetical protein
LTATRSRSAVDDDWIDAAVAAFARKHGLLAKFTTF